MPHDFPLSSDERFRVLFKQSQLTPEPVVEITLSKEKVFGSEHNIGYQTKIKFEEQNRQRTSKFGLRGSLIMDEKPQV